MPLRLTAAELQQIGQLQEILASPLQFPDAEAWAEAIHAASTELFGVQRSLVVLPRGDDDVLIHSANLSEQALAGFRESVVGTQAQMNRYGDPLLERAMVRLATSGVEVWNREVAERVTRVKLETMPRFYPEVLRPERLSQLLAMGHALEAGRAMLHLYSDDHRPTALGDREVDVLQLLLPAFRSGSRIYSRAAHRWRSFRRSVDVLGEPVALYRPGGGTHRNASLRRVLEFEEDPDRLTGEMARCAERFQRDWAVVRPSPVQDGTHVRTSQNQYQLTATHLEGGYGGQPVTVMVVAQPNRAVPPSAGALRERFGLTPRQAEVARLLALGHSNRQIGERLGISVHTARHHAQRVLEKTGTRSRKTLILRLLPGV